MSCSTLDDNRKDLIERVWCKLKFQDSAVLKKEHCITCQCIWRVFWQDYRHASPMTSYVALLHLDTSQKKLVQWTNWEPIVSSGKDSKGLFFGLKSTALDFVALIFSKDSVLHATNLCSVSLAVIVSSLTVLSVRKPQWLPFIRIYYFIFTTCTWGGITFSTCVVIRTST